MSTQTQQTFTFDRDYGNLWQIAPLYAAYTARRRELDEAGLYPYNAEFRGHLGIAPGKDEDTAIYLCQSLTNVHADALKVNEFISAGGRFLAPGERPKGRVDVATFGFYVGGSGFRVAQDVRLVYRPGAERPYMYLPKGKRTNGYSIDGVVLVRDAAKPYRGRHEAA